MAECKQIREEFSALLDDELDIETKATVEEHLAHCASCLRELGGFKQVGDLYTALEHVRAPDTFEAELRKRLRPKRFAFLLTKRFVHWQLLPLTAAATALIAIGGVFILQQIKTAEQLRLTKVEPTASVIESLQGGAKSNLSENTVLPMAAARREAEPSLLQELRIDNSSANTELKVPPQDLPTASLAAAVPEKAEAINTQSNRRVLEGRAFVLSNGIWREESFENGAMTYLQRDATKYNELAKQHPEILKFADLGPKVIFRIDQTWYLLQPLPEE